MARPPSPVQMRGHSPVGLLAASSDRQLLAALRERMNSAHQVVMVARRAPADQTELRTARIAQLLAMTQYEAALTSCRLPIPQQLHRESRLLRRLLA